MWASAAISGSPSALSAWRSTWSGSSRPVSGAPISFLRPGASTAAQGDATWASGPVVHPPPDGLPAVLVASGTHTIRVVVVGTAGRPRVDIDVLAVSQL
jgi:hypothetical protein